MLMADLIVLSACASTPTASPSPATSWLTAPTHEAALSATPSGTASPSGTNVSPSASPTVATLSGAAMPVCKPRAPAVSDSVTFVASGDAWALSPNGDHLTCLFAVAKPGPFEWGPLGDRALLAGFQVKGVAGGPAMAATGQSFATIAWSKPTGTSIVFAPKDGASLKKVHLDGTPTEDVSPIASATYLSVSYHPGGEAFAFVARLAEGESIWLSSNTGKVVTRLVFSKVGTKFGAIAFDVDGTHLLYAAQHADDQGELHLIDLTDTTRSPVVWTGRKGQRIVDIRPGRTTGTVAWTVTTTSCADTIAMTGTATGSARLLPNVARPTRALGWLDETHVLVAAGGCGAPEDLSAVDVSTGSVVPLVSGVSVAAVRTPVPVPPAPLPGPVASLGSGFG
jgi:hypothetical protein